jgi:hypothetical protein
MGTRIAKRKIVKSSLALKGEREEEGRRDNIVI